MSSGSVVEARPEEIVSAITISINREAASADQGAWSAVTVPLVDSPAATGWFAAKPSLIGDYPPIFGIRATIRIDAVNSSICSQGRKCRTAL